MIEEILVKKAGGFDATEQKLQPIKTLNFIFGTNGAGKTTISRIVANPDDYLDCQIRWQNNVKLECFVYNADFVGKNFKSQMPGIFTLGEQDAKALDDIEQARQQLDEINGQITQRTNTLRSGPVGGKEGELSTTTKELQEHCWGAKVEYDKHFEPVFAGLRNSAAKFCEKLMAEHQDNKSPLRSLDELSQKVAMIFRDGLKLESPLQRLEYQKLVDLGNVSILKKKIIGKEDVDIAALIKRLDSSDWMREGKGYFDELENQCPFCQQPTDERFSKAINEYFDDTFTQDMSRIESVIENYTNYSKEIISRTDDAIASQAQYLDMRAVIDQKQLLVAKIEMNKRLLEKKKKESSNAIELEPILPILKIIDEEISENNRAVAKHNDTFNNLKKEKETLASEVWKFVAESRQPALTVFMTKIGELKAAINGLKHSITQKNQERSEKLSELNELERKITSVQPAVTAINSILKSFGFTNFELKTAGAYNSLYEIVRTDGQDASRSLSEGEKTFLAFLYFFYLLHGNVSESGTTTNRIVIFDDPISSLDSEILFIVSSLIKRVFRDALSKTKPVKQVFVLTHNIYFHKEVSYDPLRQGTARTHETFWIIRKGDGNSLLQLFNHNPIKTSYELLWNEIRTGSANPLTVQNTLRRILESYFKILGNMDKDEIIAKFSGREQVICSTLFSWINDGSHSAHDDLYVACDATSLPAYLKVFKEVFEKTDHGKHYEMMMRTDNADAA